MKKNFYTEAFRYLLYVIYKVVPKYANISSFTISKYIHSNSNPKQQFSFYEKKKTTHSRTHTDYADTSKGINHIEKKG